MEAPPQNDEGPPQNFFDLTSSTPLEISPQNTEVDRPAQQISPLGQSQVGTTNIAMSSARSYLFKPPAFTRDLFNDFVGEDDDNIIEEEPVTIMSSAHKSDSRTLLPGFTTPEQSSRGTLSSDDTLRGGSFVKTENGDNDNIDGDGCNYNDDDEVGVFTRRSKRARSFRPDSNPLFMASRVPKLTQQGRRLPKHLRGGHRRGQHDIITGGDHQDFDYTPTSSRRSSTQSYGRVHTALPATNLIPTGGGGYLVTNSFMTAAQRRRLEQQENIEKVLTDLDECLLACPADYKLRAKKLHLEEIQRRLMKADSTALKGAEASLVKDVDKMLQRRRMNMVKAEYESQARAMLEGTEGPLPSGTKGRKRAYDEGIESMSSSWSEAMAPSEISSFSHPSTGGKTVPQDYYRRHKKRRSTHDLADNADADDEHDNDQNGHEDVVWDDEQDRKTYGGKTVAQDNLGPLSDYDTAKVLTEAMEEDSGDKKDEGDKEDSGDDVAETSDDNDEAQKETEEDCGNDDAHE